MSYYNNTDLTGTGGWQDELQDQGGHGQGQSHYAQAFTDVNPAYPTDPGQNPYAGSFMAGHHGPSNGPLPLASWEEADDYVGPINAAIMDPNYPPDGSYLGPGVDYEDYLSDDQHVLADEDRRTADKSKSSSKGKHAKGSKKHAGSSADARRDKRSHDGQRHKAGSGSKHKSASGGGGHKSTSRK